MAQIQLSQIFIPEAIIVPMQAQTRSEALHELATQFSKVYDLSTQAVETILIEREHLGVTAIGNGIAIPHGRLDVQKIMGVFAVAPHGIDFSAPDQKPVKIFTALIAPKTGDEHVRTLAIISSLLSDPARRAKICLARSTEEISQFLLS